MAKKITTIKRDSRTGQFIEVERRGRHRGAVRAFAVNETTPILPLEEPSFRERMKRTTVTYVKKGKAFEPRPVYQEIDIEGFVEELLVTDKTILDILAK